jgi:pimeloyl-ACP methyl ester carboxylesterase
MGGMIAQSVAINHPARVRSLTSISSTPSARIGTRPPLRVLRKMVKVLATPVGDPEQAARREVAIYRLMGSPGYPLDEQLIGEIGRRAYDRHPPDPAGGLRQRAAIVASGDRRAALSGLRIRRLSLTGPPS